METENVSVVLGDNVKLQTIAMATLGLDERSRQVFAGAIQKQADGLFVLSDVQQAQIALLDTDNSNAKQLFNQFQQNYPTIPLIGLGKQQTDLPIHAFAFKPLNLAQLLDTIIELVNPGLKQDKNMITEDKIAKAMQALENKNIAKSLHKRAEQTQPKTAAKRAMPGKTDEMCFDLSRFLLGVVLNALAKADCDQQIAVVSCWNDRKIVIDPKQGKISSNLNDNQIRSLAIAPIDDNLLAQTQTKFYQSGSVNSELDAILASTDLRHFPQENFLWNFGLLTCRGRIPAEFTVCNRHYLRRWPNLTRLIVPANAMRILAYWYQQPCSLMDIKTQLDVPLQDIFTVFSAAYAAGLAGEAKRQSDEIMQVAELNEHENRGLMKSIISRLRTNKSKQLSKSA